MASERSLFDRTEPRIVEDFRRFHDANPHVYRLFERFACEAHDRGATKVGAKAIWERMRWSVFVETNDPDRQFKLPNNYHALYARMFAARNPEKAFMFRMARSVADGIDLC